jgi:hypothetical protein
MQYKLCMTIDANAQHDLCIHMCCVNGVGSHSMWIGRGWERLIGFRGCMTIDAKARHNVSVHMGCVN